MKREDGRKAEDIRPTEMTAGVIPNAKGSAMVKMGNTVAVAAVYGPREMHPRHKQRSDRANLKAVYNMVPFSTSDRIRPGYSRRSIEICKVTRQALEPALFLEEFPKSSIDVFINIISANAGTRAAGINAASLALADAGIPMRDLVSSVATGKIGDEYVMDLAGKEEEETFCDLPVAYMPKHKRITLLQMDGDMKPDEIKKALELAIKGCEKLYEMQKEALKKRWIK